MTLGRCPLSIFCSRGTPPIYQPERQGHNLSLTVLRVPNSLGSGHVAARGQKRASLRQSVGRGDRFLQLLWRRIMTFETMRLEGRSTFGDPCQDSGLFRGYRLRGSRGRTNMAHVRLFYSRQSGATSGQRGKNLKGLRTFT